MAMDLSALEGINPSISPEQMESMSARVRALLRDPEQAEELRQAVLKAAQDKASFSNGIGMILKVATGLSGFFL
jgi:hypothetical protein